MTRQVHSIHWTGTASLPYLNAFTRHRKIINRQLKTSQHNHSTPNFGLFFFFCPNDLNFCMWSPVAQKITALYFFLWFVLHFQVKTYAKNRWLREALLTSLFGKTKSFFCLLFNNRLQKAPPSFFTYVLTGKRSANQRKKYRAVTFY